MQQLTIGIVTGEASGDLLGADLIFALRHKLLNNAENNPNQYTEIKIVGVLGPKLQKLAQDYNNISVELLYDSEALAIMGFVEPIKQLPRLLKMRKHLINYFVQNPPDVFIGIDSPDFNLGIEKKLKKNNIKTIHYVSPSVWAWRKGRIKTIKKAVDLMLVLFPFEKEFYQEYRVNSVFIGHPLADNIPIEIDQIAAREKLNLGLISDSDSYSYLILAMLPGSRLSEIEYLAPLYIQSALQLKLKLKAKNKKLKILVPIASKKVEEKFDEIKLNLDPLNKLEIIKVNNQAQAVMQASDLVLITSGTATLEAMLCKRPMVVVFKTSKLNAFIAKLVIKLKYFSLPNLLFNQKIVPEFFQEQATINNIEHELLNYFENKKLYSDTQDKFTQMHKTLKMQASQQAADAVLGLLKN